MNLVETEFRAMCIQRDDLIDELARVTAERDKYKTACEAEGKIIVDMAGAMDKFTPELIAAMAPLFAEPIQAMMEAEAEEDAQREVDELAMIIFDNDDIVDGIEVHDLIEPARRMRRRIAALEGSKAKPGEDYWINYDEQTGQWCVQREPFKVLRPDGVQIALRPVELFDKERALGWELAFDFLQQKGVHSSTDFVDDAGTYLGRFHAFFPAGASIEDKARHFEEMARGERAAVDATRLKFDDKRGGNAA